MVYVVCGILLGGKVLAGLRYVDGEKSIGNVGLGSSLLKATFIC